MPIKEKLDAEGKKNSERTSMQGDHSSCHFIACGVLKDLTVEDMQKVAVFENNYQPLPKMLKYSQSATHLNNVLKNEELRNSTPVKSNEKSVYQYITDHNKKSIDAGGVETRHTRITDKSNQFIELLQSLETKAGAGNAEEKEECSAKTFASKILAERQSQKQGAGLVR